VDEFQHDYEVLLLLVGVLNERKEKLFNIIDPSLLCILHGYSESDSREWHCRKFSFNFIHP
jgi:hypothetical protein